jgi:hypothetical protein
MIKKKDFFFNMALLLGSCIVGLLAMESIFPRFFYKVPVSLNPGLDEALVILTQTSKKSAFPKNYVALMGDSHAQGMGDWLQKELKENRYSFTPFDYGSAHLLYRRTGRDVISFGSAGSGSLGGIAVKPIADYLYLNSIRDFILEKPVKIIIYFYEGNDLDDNIRDMDLQYSGKYDKALLYDAAYFNGFIRGLVDQSALMDDFFPLKNFIFTRFIIKGIKNTGEEIERGAKKLFRNFNRKTQEALPTTEKSAPAAPPSPPITNKVLVGGKEVVIPDFLQGPALELTEEEMRLALYVFEQSLRYLADFFEGVPMEIVYIPSPLSSYRLASPTVSVQSYAKRSDRFEADFVVKRGQEICEKIEGIAKGHGIGFLDARKFIRKATHEQLLHGPKDWKHFNKIGYHVLVDGILAAFFSEEKSADSFGCSE